MKRRIKIVAAIICIGMLFSFTGCSNDVTVDDEVSVENVHSDYKTISHGIVQAIFTRNEDLYRACYPESASYILEYNDVNELFDGYLEDFDPELTYYGVSFSANNEYSSSDGYDEDYMRTNISMLHQIDESLIEEIDIVKERVTFKNNSGDYESSDIYMIVYKSQGAWYFFEFANSDAEFEN